MTKEQVKEWAQGLVRTPPPSGYWARHWDDYSPSERTKYRLIELLPFSWLRRWRDTTGSERAKNTFADVFVFVLYPTLGAFLYLLTRT